MGAGRIISNITRSRKGTSPVTHNWQRHWCWSPHDVRLTFPYFRLSVAYTFLSILSCTYSCEKGISLICFVVQGSKPLCNELYTAELYRRRWRSRHTASCTQQFILSAATDLFTRSRLIMNQFMAVGNRYGITSFSTAPHAIRLKNLGLICFVIDRLSWGCA